MRELGESELWSDLVCTPVAGIGAIASIRDARIATMIWVRAFGEEPPE